VKLTVEIFNYFRKNGSRSTKNPIATKKQRKKTGDEKTIIPRPKSVGGKGVAPHLYHLQESNAGPENVQAAFRKQTSEVPDARGTARRRGIKIVKIRISKK